MAGLLFFMGLSLAGQFEIGLTLTSAGGALAAKQGYTGSFFTGVLAVVVATPCTAPFMGAAIGYALAQSAAVTFVVFTALALGLGRALCGAHIAAGVDARAAQARRVDGSAAAGHLCAYLHHRDLAGVGVGAGLWRRRAGARCWRASCCWRLRAGSLAAGRRSAGRRSWRRRFCLSRSYERSRARQTGDCAGDFRLRRKLQGLWQPWSQEAVTRSLGAGQPVFVDFTASWCLSCQVNERVALSRPEVVQAFQARNVVLLKADWTRHDEAITAGAYGS